MPRLAYLDVRVFYVLLLLPLLERYVYWRNKAAEENRGLVGKCIERYESFAHSRPNKVERADLFSVGYIGLLECVESFDPDKGSFSTYAYRCIENALLHHLRYEIHDFKHTDYSWRQNSKRALNNREADKLKEFRASLTPLSLEQVDWVVADREI